MKPLNVAAKKPPSYERRRGDSNPNSYLKFTLNRLENI